MIRHCVFIRFRADIDESEVEPILAGLHEVCAPLDGIVDVRLGANRSPEVELANGYRHGFVIDFETAADRDAYLVDEAHQVFGGRLVAAAEGGADGIFVFDFELA